jgi:hypothetical protein
MFNLFASLSSNDLDVLNGAGVRVGDFIYQRAYDASAGMLPPDEAGHARVVPTTFYPAVGDIGDATVILLKSGEEHGGVDIATHAGKGFVVSGTVAGPDGPLTTMGVRLLPSAAGMAGNHVLLGGGNAVTDDRGRFIFMGIPPGSYYLSTVQSFLSGNSASLQWAQQPITIGEADITGLAVTMRPGVKLSGRIVVDSAATAKPDLTQAFISMRPVSAESWRGGRVIVSPDGTFASTGDMPGSYFVTLQRPLGWSMSRLEHGGRDVVDEPIELGASDLSDFVATITNKDSHVNGAVTDLTGAPSTHASVIVFPVDPAKRRGPTFSTRRVKRADTSENGSYDVAGLLPGDYALAAVDSAFANAWLDAKFLDRLLPSATRVTLGTGEDKSQSLKLVVLKDR